MPDWLRRAVEMSLTVMVPIGLVGILFGGLADRDYWLFITVVGSGTLLLGAAIARMRLPARLGIEADDSRKAE